MTAETLQRNEAVLKHGCRHPSTSSHENRKEQTHPSLHQVKAQSTKEKGAHRVEHDGRDVVGVTLQGLHARFGLVVPHLGHPVVGARDQEGAVACAEGTSQ